MDNKFADRLAEIIDRYETTRQSYRDFTSRSEINNDSLNEFQGRFADIKADLREYHSHFTNQWVQRDDKSATAIKFRIAVAISEDRYVDEEDPIVYEKCSITSAEKFASASKKYKEFVNQRAFIRESLTNVSDLREDCNTYINEIKNRLK